MTSYYIEETHDEQRRDDGSPVYDGYFPSGFPYDAFHDVDVPIVQVMSEGDVALPEYSFRPGYGSRRYRRADSDEVGDRYRLYELAGVPHMGTRHAPFDDVSLWQSTHGDEAAKEDVTIGPRMNSLPHFELFAMGLDHLVRWVAEGTVPPRAERLEVGPDGFFAKDELGNTRGGVRCVQLDVPHSTLPGQPGCERRHTELPHRRHRRAARRAEAANAVRRRGRLPRAVQSSVGRARRRRLAPPRRRR